MDFELGACSAFKSACINNLRKLSRVEQSSINAVKKAHWKEFNLSLSPFALGLGLSMSGMSHENEMIQELKRHLSSLALFSWTFWRKAALVCTFSLYLVLYASKLTFPRPHRRLCWPWQYKKSKKAKPKKKGISSVHGSFHFSWFIPDISSIDPSPAQGGRGPNGALSRSQQRQLRAAFARAGLPTSTLINIPAATLPPGNVPVLDGNMAQTNGNEAIPNNTATLPSTTQTLPPAPTATTPADVQMSRILQPVAPTFIPGYLQVLV